MPFIRRMSSSVIAVPVSRLSRQDSATTATPIARVSARKISETIFLTDPFSMVLSPLPLFVPSFYQNPRPADRCFLQQNVSVFQVKPLRPGPMGKALWQEVFYVVPVLLSQRIQDPFQFFLHLLREPVFAVFHLVFLADILGQPVSHFLHGDAFISL